MFVSLQIDRGKNRIRVFHFVKLRRTIDNWKNLKKNVDRPRCVSNLAYYRLRSGESTFAILAKLSETPTLYVGLELLYVSNYLIKTMLARSVLIMI